MTGAEMLFAVWRGFVVLGLAALSWYRGWGPIGAFVACIAVLYLVDALAIWNSRPRGRR